MNRHTAFFVMCFLFVPPAVFAAQVIPDNELDMITGQTGIVLNVVLDSLIGENYSQLTEEEQAGIRQLIDEAFGPLSREEIEQIINTQQLFVEMVQQLPAEDRKHIEEAFEIITAQMWKGTPADFLKMINGDQLTADNLNDWAHDKLNKILIAQQIINDMIRALPSDDYQQMINVQQIINRHLDTLKQ